MIYTTELVVEISPTYSAYILGGDVLVEITKKLVISFFDHGVDLFNKPSSRLVGRPAKTWLDGHYKGIVIHQKLAEYELDL